MPAPGSTAGAPRLHCWRATPRQTTAVSRSTPAPHRAFHDLSPAAVHQCSRPRLPRSDTPPPSPEGPAVGPRARSEEHTSELQSLTNLVCRLLLEKKKNNEQTVRHSPPHTLHPRLTHHPPPPR